MFAAEERGDVPKGTAKRGAEHTKSIKKLPEKVKKEGAFFELGKAAALSVLGLSKLAEPKGQKVEIGSRKGGKNEPMPGKRGTRFGKMVRKLEHQKGVKDPEALAGAIARSKYGPSAGRK